MHEFINSIPTLYMKGVCANIIISCNTCIKCNLTVITRYNGGISWYFIDNNCFDVKLVEKFSCEEIIIKNIIE